MVLTRAEADAQLKQLYDFMCDDIDKAISAGSNYLAALGLSTYTEILGGYHRGALSRGSSEHNYNDFLLDSHYFPASYKIADDTVRTSFGKNGLYEVVRCGLTHEYYIKMKSKVETGDATILPCGVILDVSKGEVVFIVKQYYLDFKDAFDKYFADFSRGPNANDLLRKFNVALGSIGSVLATNPSHIGNTSGAGFSVFMGPTVSTGQPAP